MSDYRLGILNGDGIGLEVVPLAVKALKSALGRYPKVKIDWQELPIGMPSYEKTGETFPDKTIETLSELDGWVLGPIGHKDYPKDPKAINPHPIIRRHFAMHANIRPVRSYDTVDSLHKNVDVVTIRENNQGFQPDRNVYRGSGEFMPDPDMAISVRIISRENSTFVAKAAFDLARRRDNMKKVTAVHKNTVFKLGCGLFAECCRDVAKQYPDIEYEEVIVDTFAMKLIMNPQSYDVFVTTNMFGDILSDVAAGLVGGLGLAPGISVGEKYVMAQAVHGSAPDIAGQGIANPYAMIASAGMMMSWLGDRKNDPDAIAAGELVVEAADQSINEGDENLTPDLGGKGSTNDMAEAIINRIKKI